MCDDPELRSFVMRSVDVFLALLSVSQSCHTTRPAIWSHFLFGYLEKGSFMAHI